MDEAERGVGLRRFALGQNEACRWRRVTLTGFTEYLKFSSAHPVDVNPFRADFQITHLLLEERKNITQLVKLTSGLLPLHVSRVLLLPLSTLKPTFC